MRVFRINILILLLTLGVAVSGQEDSLSVYLATAAKNNPEVRAAFAGYQASLRKVNAAGALPDPQLEIGFFMQPMDIIDGRQIADFTLMQMFPWFGVNKAARTEAMHMSRMAFQQFREARNRIFLQVYTSWYRLFQLKRQLSFLQESRDYLHQLENLALAGLRSDEGMSSPGMTDVLRIRIELAEAENSIENTVSALKAETARFNALLNRPADTRLFIPDSIKTMEIETELPLLLEKAKANSPMLGMISAEEDGIRAKALMDKRMSYPMLGVGIQYSVIGKRTGGHVPIGHMNGDDMIMPMLSVTLPIYRNKYKAQQEANAHLLEARKEQYQATINNLESELYMAGHDLQEAARMIRLLDKQEQLALSAYRLMLTDYSSGATQLGQLLEMQRELLNFRLQKAQATAEYNINAALIKNLISDFEINE